MFVGLLPDREVAARERCGVQFTPLPPHLPVATLKFPQAEQFGLAEQMRRASKGICANIAEGFGRQRDSSDESKRFLVIAIGSCQEMQVWARYALDLGYVDEPIASKWRGEYEEFARMLRGLQQNWK